MSMHWRLSRASHSLVRGRSGAARRGRGGVGRRCGSPLYAQIRDGPIKYGKGIAALVDVDGEARLEM